MRVAVALLCACAALSCRGKDKPADPSAADPPVLRSDAAPAVSDAAAQKPPSPEVHGGALVDFAILARDAKPPVVFDIRYATANNFTKTVVYDIARCLLRPEVARALLRAHERVAKNGYGLYIWDCYRPAAVQDKFWKLVPDPRYVARPVFKDGVVVKGSKHNRGAAVDLTLAKAGVAVDMPTDYDDFSERAHRSSRRWTRTQRANAERLEAAMVAEGFSPMPTEWWHYDGPDWRKYDFMNLPFEDSK